MSDPVEIRWTVGAEQIDPDRWAQAIIRALKGTREPHNTQATRWGTWPALAMILVLLAALTALTGDWLALVSLAPVVVIVGVLLMLNRQTVDRTAKQIRSTPSALEPFIFAADASGTRAESPSGSDTLTWGRYRNVLLDEDLIVLTLDNQSVRVLPVAALSSGQSATQVVEILRTWIAAAHSSVS